MSVTILTTLPPSLNLGLTYVFLIKLIQKSS
jgi:hypothetical protein